MNPNPKQRSRGRGNNGGNPNRISHGGSHGGGGHGGGGGHVRNINVRSQVFDSNGPEGRIRGNAHQVMEKYLALARDAASQGDRHAAENFYQHAEHYFRLINAYNQNNGQRRPQNLPTPAEDQADLGQDDDEDGEPAPRMIRSGGETAEDAAGPAPVPAEVEAVADPAIEPSAPPVAVAPVEAVAESPAESVAEPAPARPVRRRTRRPAAETVEPAAEPAAEAEPVLL